MIAKNIDYIKTLSDSHTNIKGNSSSNTRLQRKGHRDSLKGDQQNEINKAKEKSSQKERSMTRNYSPRTKLNSRKSKASKKRSEQAMAHGPDS